MKSKGSSGMGLATFNKNGQGIDHAFGYGATLNLWAGAALILTQLSHPLRCLQINMVNSHWALVDTLGITKKKDLYNDIYTKYSICPKLLESYSILDCQSYLSHFSF